MPVVVSRVAEAVAAYKTRPSPQNSPTSQGLPVRGLGAQGPVTAVKTENVRQVAPVGRQAGHPVLMSQCGGGSAAVPPARPGPTLAAGALRSSWSTERLASPISTALYSPTANIDPSPLTMGSFFGSQPGLSPISTPEHSPLLSPQVQTRNLRPELPQAPSSPSLQCRCCRPVPPACVPTGGLGEHGGNSPSLQLGSAAEEVAQVEASCVPAALLQLLGREGLQAVFGGSSASAQGAKRLCCGGCNHVFMVELNGRLAKCIRSRSSGRQLSEVLEAEMLLHSAPGLPSDRYALFPKATFLCQDSTGNLCEILVFEYLESCQSIGELIRTFERTHPCGILQQGAACTEHRESCGRSPPGGLLGCRHVKALRSLVSQAARLCRRFQALHGRRHGDFKADNVLVDRQGLPRLADFLSPYCRSCDREEFLGSLQGTHPVIHELRRVFDSEWLKNVGTAPVTSEATLSNAWLVGELQQLLELSLEQPLFGPLPDLLRGLSGGWTPQSGISLGSPGGSMQLPPAPEAAMPFAAPQCLSAWFEPAPSSLRGGARSPAIADRETSVGAAAMVAAAMAATAAAGSSPQMPGTAEVNHALQAKEPDSMNIFGQPPSLLDMLGSSSPLSSASSPFSFPSSAPGTQAVSSLSPYSPLAAPDFGAFLRNGASPLNGASPVQTPQSGRGANFGLLPWPPVSPFFPMTMPSLTPPLFVEM